MFVVCRYVSLHKIDICNILNNAFTCLGINIAETKKQMKNLQNLAFFIGKVSKECKTTLHPEPNRSLLSYMDMLLYLFRLSSSLSLSIFWVHLFFIYRIYYFPKIYLTSRLYIAKENILSGTLHKSIRICLILGKHA